jgi:hypothetical protein
MTQTAIRPPQFWINPLGSLAEQYSVYIGKPNEDATQPSSQVALMDGLGGAAIAQPFLITNGIARNTQGQQVLPTITAERYSIKFIDNDGVEVYAEEDFFSDAFGLSEEGALTADRILDSLADALVVDLTNLNYIFCKSENSGWEATTDGPDLNTYFFYTGIADAGRAGTKDTDPPNDPQGIFTGIFYDSVGNQWKIVPQPYVNATGLIDQSIDGRKTFLSDSTFEENIIQANDKYFYIQGTDGDIEGPNAIRFTVKADGSYELDQKDDVGTDWVGIESVLSTGEKVIKVKNSFIEGLITSNSKPIVFRNSSGESEEEGALRLFNGSDNVWRIQRFNAVNETETRLTIGETQLVIYDKDTIPVAIFDDPSASATEELTVITRKKGDARYSKVENFQLDTTSNYNLPSGWSVSRSNSGSFQSLVVTHNIGSRLYPVVSKGSSASTANPYILTSETNSFTVVSSNAFGTSTNILVKI